MSLLVCAQPATGDPASFVPLSGPALLQRLSVAAHIGQVTPASRLEVRPDPELVSTGIAQLDALTGGLPCGCLTEMHGLPSSGRTSVLLSVIAAATHRQEACALVDVSQAFDPHSAAAASVDLQQLLWVRCHAATPKARPPQRLGEEKTQNKSDMARMAQALKVADLLVQSGGFGLIVIDLSDLSHDQARRIPLASWFRFRRAVENTPTVLLVMGQGPCARTCASLVLRLEKSSAVSFQLSALSSQLSVVNGLGSRITVHNFAHPSEVPEGPAHARLLDGISVNLEMQRSRLHRKPAQSDKTGFGTRTAWKIATNVF
ncbi:MAG TPA: hypothetical protein VF011_08310 [Terriglobales bacterium]